MNSSARRHRSCRRPGCRRGISPCLTVYPLDNPVSTLRPDVPGISILGETIQMRPLILLSLCAALALNGQPYTKGVGVYPGDPKQDFAPAVVPASVTGERNLALRRPAYQSSAYDYNLTAQLVTDGIKETTLPRWFTMTTSDH